MRPPATRMAGFTLVELLIVVALLSAVSLTMFGGLAEDRVQLRYDDTKNRLQILRRAVLGQNGPSTTEAAAGFIADNGAMPTDLATLIEPGTLLARAVQSPLFDPKPDDTSCANDGGETALTDAAAQLVKGHRGDYLGGLSFNGHFRDGWGNQSASDDAANSGWSVAYDDTSKALSLVSLGTDNTTGGDDFAADIGTTISATDWLLPISGWTVTAKNAQLGDATTTLDILPGKLSVSLLVFANDSSGTGKWLRYATASLSCMDGNGDGIVNGAACSRTASAVFTDGCMPGESVVGKGRIPQGRHLLLLTDNGVDGAPWTADDKIHSSITLTGSSPIFAQVDAIAARNLPTVTLEIR
ncbi:MAG TPA: prepilin-type N-terminal cleavage/methylation domain-containing protein [Pseudomonas sp.]|nr:prepilin-type N-terminal cleavage/methylation domain-containing protein [Pseudomonas sp.]